MTFRSMVRNFLSLSAGNVISQLIVFYSFVYLAGILDAEEFGLFAFSQAVINFASRTTEFGLETIAVRRITQHYGDAAVYENVVTVRLLLALVAIGGLALWTGVMGWSDRTAVLSILSLSIIGLSFSVEWKFLAVERMGVVSVIRVVRSLVFFVPLVMVIDQHRSVVLVSWMFSLSFLLVNSAAAVLLFVRSGASWRGVSRERMASLMRESAPIAIANLLMQVQYYSSTFILGLMDGNTAVATFSAAYRPLIAVWSFGVMAVYNAIFPGMNAAASDATMFMQYVRRITAVLVFAAVGFFLVLYPSSGMLMTLLYHGRFPEAGRVFALSLGVIVLVVMRTATEYSMVSQRLQKEYLSGMVLVSVMYIVGCTLFGRVFGTMGMVYASLTAEMVYTLYIVLVSRRYLHGIGTGMLFLKAGVLCIVAATVLSPIFSMGSTLTTMVYFGVAAGGLLLFRLFPFPVGPWFPRRGTV